MTRMPDHSSPARERPVAGAASPLGQNVPRREGVAKVTGRAQFLDDRPRIGVWVAGTVRADVPCARLVAVHFDGGFDWNRVVVVTAADIPGENVVPMVERDQPALAETWIRYRGEPVALIAAPDAATLRQALDSVRVETQPLPPTFSVDDALSATGAKIHEPENVFRTIRIIKGDAAAALQSADVVIEGEYRTGAQEHLYLEPQGMQAEPAEDGITIHGSLQCPTYVVEAVATVLNLPFDRVRVHACLTGGGFGGKEDFPSLIAAHAALLAWKAKRPVRLVYERVEDMRYTSKRHPSRIIHRTGWTRSGQIVAMQVDLVLDGGAYSTLSPLVLQRSAIHACGPYQCDNLQVVARAVATNHPPRGGFRGFGGPQALFALEAHLDYCAAKLGLDPIEVRRRNLIRPGGSLGTGQNVGQDAAASEVLERALGDSRFLERRREFDVFNRQTAAEGAVPQFRRRGIGLSLFMHGTGLNGNAEAIVASEVGLRGNRDGTISVLHRQVEIGQGALTILAQVAAEGLQIPVEWVTVEEPDSARMPDSGPTVGSRTTTIVGGLLFRAGRKFRARIESDAGGPIGDPAAFRSAVARLASLEPVEVRELYRHPDDMHWDEDRHSGAPYCAYTWSCCVVALEVDTLTGEVQVLDVTSVHDAGRVVNPRLAAGQVEGGVTQGLGWALLEDIAWSDGTMQNATMSGYSVPTSMDAPPIRAVLLEHPNPRVPHGAKGLGEPPIEGPAPAVVNALRQACGVHFCRLPVTPEVILQALEGT